MKVAKQLPEPDAAEHLRNVLAAGRVAAQWMEAFMRQLQAEGHVSENGPADRALNNLRRAMDNAEGK